MANRAVNPRCRHIQYASTVNTFVLHCGGVLHVAKYAAKSECRSRAAKECFGTAVRSADDDTKATTIFRKTLFGAMRQRDISAPEAAHLLDGGTMVGSTFSIKTFNLRDDSQHIDFDAPEDEPTRMSDLQQYFVYGWSPSNEPYHKVYAPQGGSPRVVRSVAADV